MGFHCIIRAMIISLKCCIQAFFKMFTASVLFLVDEHSLAETPAVTPAWCYQCKWS